ARAAGNTVIVSGQTGSPDYPVTPLALDTTYGNPEGRSNDGFVTKIALDPDTSGDLSADSPALVSPTDGFTFHNGLIGRLEWSPVADASGIEAYEYELS